MISTTEQYKGSLDYLSCSWIFHFILPSSRLVTLENILLIFSGKGAKSLISGIKALNTNKR